MKAFILAAGNGTRLRPLTDKIPKCLVPVAGVPMLKLWLDLCSAHGIDEVTVNVHSHAERVRQFLRDENCKISVRVFDEPELLGSAGTLRANRDWIGSDGAFWVLYGDVLTTIDLSRMYEFHQAKGQLATLALDETPTPTACGIATLDSDGIIKNFVEKPRHPTGNLAFSGIMLASPCVLDEIPVQTPVDIGFSLLPRLAGRMAGYYTREYLIDIGTLEAYERAQTDWPAAQLEARSGSHCVTGYTRG